MPPFFPATNDNFAQACERLERFKERDHDLVGPSGRTFALLHPRKTPKSALLLHGLTSGPKQFVAIGQAARTQPPRAKTIVVVTNKHESAVNNRATGRLVAAWRQRRPDVQTFSFENLPISHDIIEPLRHSWIAQRVYPDVLRLLAP